MPSNTPTRAEIVAAAREWQGVPFHHQGRTRAGCDCAGVLIGVARDLEIEVFDLTTYDHDPDERELRRILAANMRAIPIADAQPGSVYLMQFGGRATHLALRTDLGILHAYAPVRRVVETALDPVLARAIVGAWEFLWLS